MYKVFRWTRRNCLIRISCMVILVLVLQCYTFEWMPSMLISKTDNQDYNDVAIEHFTTKHEERNNEDTITTNEPTIRISPILENSKRSSKHSAGFKSGNHRFALPLIAFQSGPNGIYNAFRRAMVFATLHGRCLVVPPFHDHKVQDGITKGRSLNETFDVQKLTEAVNLCDLDQYKEHCGDKISESMIIVPPVIKRTVESIDNYNKEVQKYYRNETVYLYDKFVESFFNDTGLVLPKINTVLSYSQGERERMVIENESADCLVYFPAVKPLLQESDAVKSTQIASHLVRASYIQHMASEVTGNLCGGRYAALHWRNRTGEKCGLESTKDICQSLHRRKLRELASVLDQIVDSLKSYLEAQDIGCLYVAAPPYSQAIFASLRQSLPKVITLDNLLDSYHTVSHYKEELYVLSLLEQEIAERSTMFIGTTSSNWSFYVETSRHLRGKESVYLQNIPGMPEIYHTRTKHVV